ncbi:cystathionine beta-synthase [Thermoflavifilum aggregans]|uniref:Cystathionine beta-synthase n=1 Tax=Thermoflavifilum aggregans TaxID=454188 RepID=A0A2M9CWF0_9BACT|nr:pyridoxal-phosphate dependent enzyme [Thermoflavifilum aggregans]PJJ76230.1 cystathionine beta-synthase [Thermoflavifilum aggregans]
MAYYQNILETIGHTPLVKLNRVTAELPCTVLAKVEFFNPGHSIKDRMAVKMIEDAEKAGLLRPGGTIIEGTSGNTGMGLAMAAIVKGYKCIFTITDKQSKEKIDILKALGAEVIVCPTNVEPDDPRSYYSVAKRLAKEIPNSIYIDQYNNLSNRQAHYETTGPEIWEQTEGKITHLVVGAGTGGTITGTGMFLKEKNPNIQVWAIDTYGSLLKKYHDTGEIDMNEVYPYITEGIGEDFVPANYDMSVIDHFEKVTDKDGAIMARRITKEEGIFVGYSAGSAVAGLLQLKDRLKPEHLVVVIFHDHGSRYVGKIYNDQWMLERGFLHVKTVKDMLNARVHDRLIAIEAHEPVTHAIELMQHHDIGQLPVMKNGEPIGSLSESGIFNKLLRDPHIRNAKAEEAMEKPFPVVGMDTPIERLSAYINKDNGAVLCKDESGNYHIITKYDIIVALASA